MKTNTIKNLLIGAFTTFVVMIGVGMETSAQAQHRIIIRGPRIIIGRHYRPNWDRFWERRRFDWVEHVSEQREEGYSDGFEAGKRDAREGNDFEPVDQKKYIKSPSFAYRRAFVCGYEDGYRREMKNID